MTLHVSNVKYIKYDFISRHITKRVDIEFLKIIRHEKTFAIVTKI